MTILMMMKMTITTITVTTITTDHNLLDMQFALTLKSDSLCQCQMALQCSKWIRTHADLLKAIGLLVRHNNDISTLADQSNKLR